MYSRDSGHDIRPPGDPSDPDPVEPITSDTQQRNGATVASSMVASGLTPSGDPSQQGLAFPAGPNRGRPGQPARPLSDLTAAQRRISFAEDAAPSSSTHTATAHDPRHANPTEPAPPTAAATSEDPSLPTSAQKGQSYGWTIAASHNPAPPSTETPSPAYRPLQVQERPILASGTMEGNASNGADADPSLQSHRAHQARGGAGGPKNQDRRSPRPRDLHKQHRPARAA